MWTSNKKKYFFFLTVVLCIGFVCGIFFINKIDESSKEIVLNNINAWIQNLNGSHFNTIISHLLILSLFLVIASFVVGMPLFIFYIFYNGFSLGFIVSSLGSIFGIKGVLYSLVFIIVTKGLFIFLVLNFVMFLLKIGEKVFLRFINKKERNGADVLPVLFKKSLVLMGIIFLNDILLYFVGGKILNVFNFLII